MEDPSSQIEPTRAERPAHRGSGSAPSDRRQLSLLSIVIPVLNEADGIDPLVARLAPAVENLAQAYEVIFVDDGSSDTSLHELRDLNRRDDRFKVVSLSRNFGKEIAVAAGLKHASGDAVVLMDADLQHPPELIAKMVLLWRQGEDVVYGQRNDRQVGGPTRRILARFFYWVFGTLSGTRLPDNAGDFRLLSRRAVDALNAIGERARFNKGLFAWIGFRSVGVPYDVAERITADKRTRWKPVRLFRFAVDGIASFTTIPLRIWSYIGLAVSLLAIAYAAYFLIKTLVFGSDLAGFPTLIVSIMLLGGIQLISLGVIGEYLGRIYDEVKARPLYLVSETLGFDADGTDAEASGSEVAENREKRRARVETSKL